MLVPGYAALGQPAISFGQDPPANSNGPVNIAFTVTGADPKVRVKLSVDGIDSVTSDEISQTGEYVLTVNLFTGNNTITVIGFVGGNPVNFAGGSGQKSSVCAGRWCKAPFSLTPANVASLMGAAPPLAPGGGVAASGITIEWPTNNMILRDETFINPIIKVTDGTISKVFVRVLNKEKPVEQKQDTYVVDRTDGNNIVNARIRIGPGDNDILVFDAKKDGPGTHRESIRIKCDGPDCGVESEVATIITNSQNTRAVVGMEQAGASSTTSETKPFLDFFFTAPLFFDRKEPKPPRLAAWGQVRLASTPDQLTTTSILPTNLINLVTQTGTTGSLVQSFDFLAGLEVRAFTANGSFLGLIPGIKQKTRFYIAGGGGAISPLTVKRENAQIFKIPVPGDSQYDLFVDRYGTPPAGKEFVAFVPLDRDRFLRQWYAGLRLKTYYCEDPDCTRFRNNFPGIFDFMVGQNEAVTGGSRKYGGVPDPLDSTKIIGEKNTYVLRLDAFYPLPFQSASFIYLYGTAMMKIGGGRVKVINPLFLDPATSPITDPKVFIPPADLQQLLQPNRDYYKIGVGINLTDLFNRSRTPPQ